MPEAGTGAISGGSRPTVARILLGTQLRQLRESLGISAREAARAIRGSPSKISRIELGRTAVRAADITGLLDRYRVTDQAPRDRLLALASQANQPGWWHGYADVLPGWSQPYLGLEESAAALRSFDAHFVPGLMQTDGYAIAALRLRGYQARQAGRLAQVRRERQRRFESGTARLEAVVDEVALRRPVGSAAVMHAQLGHLLELSARPDLTLLVSPLLTGASYAAPSGFSILSFAAEELPDVVYVEQLTGAMYLDRPADVARYAQAMDQIRAASYPPAQTAEFIRSVRAGLGIS